MIAIVATEAAGIAHVPDVIRVCSPGDLHIWKTIGGEHSDQTLACRFDEVRMCFEDIRVFVAIKLRELLGNFDSRFRFGRVIGLEQLECPSCEPRAVPD